MSEQLAFRPATELAELLRRKELSSVELTRHYIDRIERLDRPNAPMACLWLVWTGLARDPLRFGLTAGSVAIAFALLWLPKGVDAGLKRQIDSIPGDLLYVTSRGPSHVQLPLGSRHSLDDVAGVLHVTPFGYHNTKHGPTQDRVGVLAVDLEPYLLATYDFLVEPATVQAFLDTPGAAIAGADIAERFDWMVGDRVAGVPVGVPGDGWSFELVGTWRHELSPRESDSLIVSHAHVDQPLPDEMQGLVHAFGVRIEDATRADAVAAAIDDHFSNSTAPTLTAVTRDVSMAGRHPQQVRLLANGVVGASLFAILFCTAGVMAQSFRDRRREFAVMKSLGFGNGTLLLGIFGESATTCAVGALIALVPASLIDAGDLLGRYGAVVYPPPFEIEIQRMTGVDRGARDGALTQDAESLQHLENANTPAVAETGALTEGRPKLRATINLWDIAEERRPSLARA